MTLKEQYARERRRLTNAVSRETKKGYIFLSSPIPPKPKTITKASISRLQKLTPGKIREKAYVVTPEGELIKQAQAQKRGLLTGRAQTPVKSYQQLVKEATTISATTPRPPKTGTQPTEKITTPKSSTDKPIRTKPTQTKKETAGPVKISVTPMQPNERSLLIYSNFKSQILGRMYTVGGPLLERYLALAERTYGIEKLSQMIEEAYNNGFELSEAVFYDESSALEAINDLQQFMPTIVDEFVDVGELIDYLDEWEEAL